MHPDLNHHASRVAALAVAAGFCLLAAQTPAADWPQWRGPHRNGHAAAGSPAITALPKDLKPVWKIAIGQVNGPGFSAPIVASGSVLYVDEQDGKEVLHRIDAGTAKEQWRTVIADAEADNWGSGPRSTPFVDGPFVFYQSMNGEFRCVDLNDGKVRWGVSFSNYGARFLGSTAGEGTATRRGNAGSGIADGKFVYLPVGAKGASIVCFDKQTGEEIWKALDDEAAYSSFQVVTLAGIRQLVAFTAEALAGLDLQTGKQLWRVPFRTNAKRHAGSPVLLGNDALAVNSHTFGMVATRILREGETLKPTQLWSNKQVNINIGTPVFLDGFLYSQGGVNSKALVCVDAATGQVKWSEPGFGGETRDYSSLIAVGKNLLVLTFNGQLLLLASNPEKFTEIGRVQVCGNTWSYPAFADGRLYVRDGRELQCFDLTAKEMAVQR